MKKLLLFLCSACVCFAAPTTIQDTIYYANGLKANAKIIIQPTAAFTANADGHFVGPQAQTIDVVNGALSVALEPTDNVFPPGISYSVDIYLSDGSHRQEQWYVPTSASPVTISSVRASSRTLPQTAVPSTSIASMGATAGQALVWNGHAWMPANVSGGGSALIQKGALLTADGTSQQTLSPGADGSVLTADSTQPYGLNYVLREFPLTFSGPLQRSGNTISAPTVVTTAGSYSDPSWILSLNASKIVGSLGSAAMPIATASSVGAVKPGTGLQVDVAGVLTPQFGNSAGTVMQGNDSRVLNALQSTNTYADPSWITSLGAGKLNGIINSANLPAATTTNAGASKPGTGLTGAADGTYSVNYGTTAGTAAQGNDPRITGALQSTGTYADPVWLTSLGSGKISGQIPYTQISGLAASATTDTTNANNIVAGTIGSARLPAPTTANLGGVKSLTCGSGHVSAIDISGTPVCTPDIGAVGTLLQANNLSDLSSPTTARQNLGLGTSATHPTTDFLQSASNLADITNAVTARNNLGLGSSATLPSTAFLQPGNNLSELVSPATARTNLGLPATVTQDATNASNLASGTVNAARLPSTVVQTTGPATFGANTYDFSGASHSLPMKVGVAAAKPATCTVGELYYSSDSPAGSNVYACTSSNVWTLEAGGGAGGGGLLAANNLSDVSNVATARNNLGLGSSATQPSTAFLNAANNLADLPSAAAARSNLGLPSSVTVDSTNASNLASGTVPPARLPAPGTTTLGAVKSLSAPAHQFLNGIGTDGVPTAAQPTAADISGLANSAVVDATNAANIGSGTLPAARLPNPSATTLGGTQSGAAAAHQFMTGISTLGVPQFAQPAAADVSGLANSATTDTTNASNISVGTLSASRLPGTVLQSGNNIALSGNSFDLSAESHTTPFKTGANSSKPSTCTVGETFFASDATPGANIYLCTASNTWTLQAGSSSNGLVASNNLSDVSSASAARTNLGLGSAATQSTSVFLQSSNNLSDLTNAATARTNLGLGPVAQYSAALQPNNNLADLSSASTARTNLGLSASAVTDTTNAANISSGTLSAARLPGTVLQSGTNIALTSNTFDLSGESHTMPAVKGPGASKPATCVTGEQFFATDASPGQNLYFCTAANTWTQISSSNGLLPANNLSDVANVAQARTNLGLNTAAQQPSSAFLNTANNLSDLASPSTARANLGLPPNSTIDATNASNISAGTLNIARLPSLSSSVLTDSAQLMRNNIANTLSLVAAPSTPVSGLAMWADSTNNVLAAKSANGTVSNTVVPAVSTPHQFVNGMTTAGVLTTAQPAASDVLGLAPSATIDTTSATNIITGTLGAARLPSSVVQNNASVQFLAGVTVDSSFAAHTLPMKVGTASNKPSTCIVGEEYFATDTTAGQNLYFCTATNIWTQQTAGGGSASGALLASNNLSDLTNTGVARSNLGLSSWVLTDTTNAANISTGVLSAARLPAPTASTLGGVKSLTCASGHIASIDTTGTPTCTADAGGGGSSTSINGTTVPTNSAANTVLLTTAPATGAWAALLNCPDTAGQHLNYNTTTHQFTCGTTGGTGSPSLSSISYTASGTGAVTETALQKISQTVSVLDYGAKCDGTTDDSGAFTNAMNMGQVVTVPANSTCVVHGLSPASNTTLRGLGNSRLLKLAGSNSDYLFNIAFANNVTLENLIFDLNGNSQASAALPMMIGTQNSTNVIIRNNTFQNTGAAQIGVGGVNFWTVSGRIDHNTFLNTVPGTQVRIDTSGAGNNRMEVTGNMLDGSQQNAIQVINSSSTETSVNVEVSGNVITNVTDSAHDTGQTGNAIDVYLADNVQIHHNRMDSMAYSGIRIATANLANVHDNWINKAHEVSIWCAELGGANNHCHHNYIENYVGGFQDTNVSQRTADAPNYIEENYLVNGSDYGIHAEHAVVIGNVIDGTPFGVTVGYGATTHNNVVQNNRILRSSTSYPNVDVGIGIDTNLNTGKDVISGNSVEGTPVVAAVMGANFPVQWTVTNVTNAVTPTVSFNAGSAPVNGSTICFAQIYGMTQLNGQCGTVSNPTYNSTTQTGTLNINIDTSSYGTFANDPIVFDLSPRFFAFKYSNGSPVYTTPSTMLITNQQLPYAFLGNAADGSQVFVTDGTAGASCSGGGTGVMALHVAGVWTCTQSGGGSASAGGASGQVQYNAAGSLGGDGGLTYNSGTQVITANGGFVSGGSSTGSAILTDATSNNSVTITPTSAVTAGYTFYLPKTAVAATATAAQYSVGTPSASWGTGAGTSPTGTSVSGNNSAFNISFTAGTTPAAGTIGTFTFSQAWTNTPVCIVQQNGSGITNLGWSVTTTALTVTDTAAVTASTAYKLSVLCSQ